MVRVLDALAFDGQLLADLLQVGGARVQFLDRPLQALEAQDQRGDVVQRSTGGGSSDYDLNAVGCCLVLVVLAHSAILSLFPRVGGRVPGGASLLVVVALATLVGPFSAAHLEREVDLLGYSVPYRVNTVPVVEALEDAVAADHDEVEIVLNFEALDVGVADNHVWIASEPWSLRLDVAERL